MGRLGAEAARAVQAAHDLALRYRHEAVEPVHLLGALVADDRIEAALTTRAVDRKELAARTLARLVAWPTSSPYRGVAASPLPSTALSSLLDHAGQGRLLSLLWPITFEQLTRATCTERSVARLLRDARAEIKSAPDAVAQSHTLAIARGEGWVSIYHLLHVLAEQPWMVDALRLVAIDADDLLSRLQSRLDAEPRVEDLLHERIDKLAGRSLVVAATLRSKAIESLFAELGCAVPDLIRALVRSSGASVSDDDLPDEDDDGDAPIEVVFHDDEFTTMEFVVDVLQRCFAIPTSVTAMRLMLAVHERGASVVRTFPATEARWRIEKGRALAREAGMPLRITWRRAARPLSG